MIIYPYEYELIIYDNIKIVFKIKFGKLKKKF